MSCDINGTATHCLVCGSRMQQQCGHIGAAGALSHEKSHAVNLIGTPEIRTATSSSPRNRSKYTRPFPREGVGSGNETIVSLVARPLPVFQCCTLKNERTWPGARAHVHDAITAYCACHVRRKRSPSVFEKLPVTSNRYKKEGLSACNSLVSLNDRTAVGYTL